LLEHLLSRAESARRRGASEQVGLKPANQDDYRALASLIEVEAFRAEVALAERAGAIHVSRDHYRGDGKTITMLRVASVEALARHLGVSLHEDRVRVAERTLAPWRERFPILIDVVAAWRAKRTVRQAGPEAALDLADAARAVAARLDDAGSERILRRESVRLFGDSKRLERITKWLHILVTGELAASGLSDEEVWAAIGLRREPQPLLLAGTGTVTLAGATLPLVRPYLGLPMEAVHAITTPARWLLSIENLATFHDAARAPQAADGLVIYTGGMPSPAWRGAYQHLLAGLPAQAAVLHWGDIDEGGFRIAAAIAASARLTGHTLLPWCMAPGDLPVAIIQGVTPPKPATLAAMRHWAEQAGWHRLSTELAHRPVKLEQERLDIRLPTSEDTARAPC
jgi:hypothetical protein